ncbi:MAG: preprotein translocase subunit SecB [Lachnospiraceae bacterium]|nr:preprotein translocase subunit SecB [Lachnospiraceae bacterium]MCI9356839.1 preprotein translocase subunit SecB [Lachnospiraceae bacterium]
MNINDMKSDLTMDNLFFRECIVKRNAMISNGEYQADLEKDIKKAGEHTYNVELQLSIYKEDLEVSVVANAQFIYKAENYEREESVINNNTVAIMFPFIRSQVTLLTTQPGMAPIVLPPINTQKYV